MAAPHVMATATWGNVTQQCQSTTPTLDTATPGNAEVSLTWTPAPDDAGDGYNVYYDQAGKAFFVADAGQASTYTDLGLTNGSEYCYKVTSYTTATADTPGC